MNARSDTPVTVRKPRRWLRYSLRSLLVVMTILCLWLGWQTKRAHDQRAAVAFINTLGGKVQEYDRKPEDVWAPAWIRDRVGLDFFLSVKNVLLNKGVTSENLRETVSHLQKLPKLKDFELTNTELTDEELRPLAELTQVENLCFGYPQTPITGEGLAHLAKLRLKKLILVECNCPKNVLEAIVAIPSLEHLTLMQMQVEQTAQGAADVESTEDNESFDLENDFTMVEFVFSGGRRGIMNEQDEALKQWVQKLRPELVFSHYNFVH